MRTETLKAITERKYFGTITSEELEQIARAEFDKGEAYICNGAYYDTKTNAFICEVETA